MRPTGAFRGRVKVDRPFPIGIGRAVTGLDVR
jgi:hypothetical protein